MASQQEIDALVKMLDQNMSNGSGHINIKVNDPDHIEIEKVDVISGAACDLGDTACKTPTVMLPDDDEF